MKANFVDRVTLGGDPWKSTKSWYPLSLSIVELIVGSLYFELVGVNCGVLVGDRESAALTEKVKPLECSQKVQGEAESGSSRNVVKHNVKELM